MKCKHCGRELSDDARFCEICGKPVDTEPTLVADKTTQIDPHYDLSVFSDDSAPAPARQTPAPVVEDDAAKTVLLPQNDSPGSGLPTRPARRVEADSFPVEDDAVKTELLPDSDAQPVQRNRFEENLAMHRRYREEETRSGYANSANHAPRRDTNAQNPNPYYDEYRGYAPANRQESRDRFLDNRRTRYDDSFDESNRRANRGSRYDGSPDIDANRERNRRADRRNEPPKNNKKKALIISLIALILVVAILAGVIFFVNRNTVSASELKDAKEKYLPPAQAVTIDTSQKDPSNDDIQFKYDDRARIVSCTYQANNKPYVQRYTYHDPERTVHIATTYREKPIHTESISYDNIKTPDKFEDIGGYIVRLDEESLTGGLPAAEERTEAPTAAPTAAPTEARTIVDAQSDEAMEKFLTTFVCCYAYNVGEFEYDYLNRQGTNPNILEKVCQQFPIVDWELYSSNGRVEGWNTEGLRQKNQTGLTPADAPWIDESQASSAMGVAANRCDTADWICTNIFNVNAGDLPTLYEQCYANQKLWKAEASVGTSYCAVIYGRGSVGYGVNVRDVKTDGQYYYVTYDRCDPYSKDPVETLYAVMEKKTIDGGTYWSMYSNTNQIPDTITPFTP